ncbi:hypothetical protein L6164_019868 [Bauhinia variegata]|uniref:Uncharacterized protein n=1 Tax=Bauhinia variegata TaxID=167791 RepID=A0ACB9MV87_BAUVA|nr:hypothetical protein L6164_019868 [Bauhinia variegata]
MRLSAIVLMVLMMVLVTRSGPVSCRVLASQVKVEKTDNPQPDKELEILGSASVKVEKGNPADGASGRVLIGDRVYTMASGPSRKGSGH